ncbi:peptide ABC transporter substrate-binding protein [bacterium]|nr:peptide ABC transporter substrate-binding protein [bacterium]
MGVMKIRGLSGWGSLGILCSVVGFCGALSACQKTSSSNVIRIQLSAEPVSLDPALAEDALAFRILNNIMEGLFRNDSEGRLEGRLATSFEVSPNGLEYKISLRDGVRWSDGLPLQAKDVVAGIQRSIDPKLSSKLSLFLSKIASVKGVEKSGDSPALVTIHLKEPVPYLPKLLTLPQTFPYRGHDWTGGSPVLGAYRMRAHQLEQGYDLEPNQYYWETMEGTRPVRLEIVRDESTASSLFDRGKLDLLTKVPAYDFKRYSEKGLIRVAPMLATNYLAFNTRKPPFNNREYRKIFSRSIQRGEITRMLDTREVPSFGWIPPELKNYKDPIFVEWGREASDLSVKDALLAKLKGAPVITGFDSSGRNTSIMEVIQNQVKRSIGVELKLEPMDWKSYIQQLSVDPPQVYRLGWVAPFGDGLTHLEILTSKNPNNYTGWKNARYDSLVDQIAHLPVGVQREGKMREAEKILIQEEAVVVPIYYFVQSYAVAPRLKNFRVNPNSILYFSELRLKLPK